MHLYAYGALAQMLQIVPVPTRVLEVGSRETNGTPRGLFPGVPYLGLDTRDGPGVDVVADGKTVTLEALGEQPDCIVCAEVLEHEADPRNLVMHLADLLPRGGSLLITCATEGRAPHSAEDGSALEAEEHYRNIGSLELSSWVEQAGCRVVYRVSRPDRGDLYLAAVRR